MTKRAHLVDGTILEFPDETPDEVMDRTVRAHVNNPANKSRAIGLVGGALKPVDNLAAIASQIPVIGPAVDELGQSLGMPSTADAVANNQAMRANNTRTGYQMVGNILSTLPTSRLGGPAVSGAASGALLTDATDPVGIIRDTLLGAAGGKLGQTIGDFVGAVAAPKISAGARRLANAGILQTPGQLLAGSKGLAARLVNKAEEGLASVPFLGDMINISRESGTEAYNRALGNRVLGNIGKTLPSRAQPGENFVSGIRRTVSNQYDRLVPNLVGNFDQTFANDLAGAKALTNGLPDSVQNQFERITRDVFWNRSGGARATSINGQALKDAESKLTKLIGNYASSSDADQRILGDALKSTREALRGMIVRSNPQHAEELQALNKAWAMLRPMKQASEAAPDRVITPQRMFQAQRRTGVNDPLVNTAAARLTNRTPDSGTAGRMLRAASVAGLGTGAIFNPAMAAPALASLLYSKPGMQALNKAVFASRGPVAKAVAKGARALPAAVPALGPLALLGLFGRLGD